MIGDIIFWTYFVILFPLIPFIFFVLWCSDNFKLKRYLKAGNHWDGHHKYFGTPENALHYIKTLELQQQHKVISSGAGMSPAQYEAIIHLFADRLVESWHETEVKVDLPTFMGLDKAEYQAFVNCNWREIKP